MKIPYHAMVSLLSLLIGTVAFAADEKPAYDDTVLGDVGGARSRLAEAGVEVGLDYAGDVWAVTDGGKKRITTYLDLITLRADLDGQKLFGITGNTLSIALIDSNGTKTNAATVGSTQGIDNGEVGANAVRVFEAWVNQEFLDGRLAVLFGLHDLNSEFAATEASANFLKPSMQIGQSFAQSGRNGPSIFPTTALAVRVKLLPTPDSYVAVAAYDGVPGDTSDARATRINLDDKDGVLLVGEVGYTPGMADTDAPLNKLAIGFWNYTVPIDDLTDLDINGNPAKSTAQGAYLLSSYRFYHDKPAGRDLTGFLRGGLADGDTAQVDWDYELGMVANGWVPTRPDSEIGLGLSQAHNADKYITSVAGASDRNEYSYELYYRDTIAHGVSVQPDLQYIVNPGTDQVTEHATVVGMRLNVSF